MIERNKSILKGSILGIFLKKRAFFIPIRIKEIQTKKADKTITAKCTGID